MLLNCDSNTVSLTLTRGLQYHAVYNIMPLNIMLRLAAASAHLPCTCTPLPSALSRIRQSVYVCAYAMTS